MEKINLFIPQWQGSGLTNELLSGAKALKKYIEKNNYNSFTDIKILDNDSSELKNNIIGYDVIIDQLKRAQNVLNNDNPKRIFTIGGDCSIEIPVVSHLQQIYRELTLFWFDAHGDLNSPETSPSKLFHGMPLRFLLDIDNSLDEIAINKIPFKNINLIGTRDLDKPESEYIFKKSISVISVNDIKNKEKYAEQIKRTSGKAYIHIDLDVLDPGYYNNVKCPTDYGISFDELAYSIEVIKNHLDVVGLSIVENTEIDDSIIKKLEGIIEIGLNI